MSPRRRWVLQLSVVMVLCFVLGWVIGATDARAADAAASAGADTTAIGQLRAAGAARGAQP